MSGRKSSEVNSMLARGIEAREAGEANFKNNFNHALDALKIHESQIAKLNKNISKILPKALIVISSNMSFSTSTIYFHKFHHTQN